MSTLHPSKDITLNPVQTAVKASGASLLGLSTRSGIPRTSLRRMIVNPGTLTLGDLDALARSLGKAGEGLAVRLIDYLANEPREAARAIRRPAGVDDQLRQLDDE